MAKALRYALAAVALAALGFAVLLIITNTTHVDFGLGHVAALAVVAGLMYAVVRAVRKR